MKGNTIAIVAAAGIGKRFDPHIRKTFVPLRGIPLVAHTIKKLHNEKSVHEILPVLHKEDMEKGHKIVRDFEFNKIERIAEGGEERQDSIFNALKLLGARDGALYGETVILVHDGARPFIPEGLIERLLTELEHYDAVVPGLPVKDTLKEVMTDGSVVSTLDRGKIRAIQTPQAFKFSTLKEAYERAASEQFYATDDAALVERAGGRVKVIEGDAYNIKITTPEDLEMVEDVIVRERFAG